MDAASAIPFCALVFPMVWRETSESGVTTYVTMNGVRCQPERACNLSRPAGIVPKETPDKLEVRLLKE